MSLQEHLGDALEVVLGEEEFALDELTLGIFAA